MSESQINEHQTSAKPAKKHHVGANIFMVFAVLILLATIFMAVFLKMSGNSDRLFLFGYKPYVVTVDSMESEYKKFAFVIIKQAEKVDDVEIGDVVAYRSYDENGKLRPIFHRAIEKTESGLITKGDNRSTADSQTVTDDSIVGVRAWHTNLLAEIIEIFMVPRNLFLLIASVAIVFSGLLILVLRSRVKKTAN